MGNLLTAVPLTSGTVHTTVLLNTTVGQYVFRLYETRTADYIQFELRILEQLAQQGFPCASPIRDRRGMMFSMYFRKPYAIFPLMHGEHDASINHRREVAAILAKMHVLTLTTEPSHYEARDTYDQCSCLIDAESNLKHLTPPGEAARRLSRIKEELASIRIPKELPRGICHCDTNPSNFLYFHGRISAVLDFDMASYTWLLYDVATVLYWWAYPRTHESWLSRTREILQAYQDVRPLTELEKQHIFDIWKMVLLTNIGWFAHVDDDYLSGFKTIDYLNSIGREEFTTSLFNKRC